VLSYVVGLNLVDWDPTPVGIQSLRGLFICPLMDVSTEGIVIADAILCCD